MNPSANAYTRIIDALRAAGQTVNGDDESAMAQCPAHDDGQASLKLTDAPGKVLMHCFAGCETRDVLAALNLTQADLFDTPGGISYLYAGGRKVTRTPDKKFRQSGNKDDRSLFQVEDIANADIVYVTEGEQDAVTLATLCTVAAVSPPQGAKTRPDRWDWTPLEGRHVVIIADNDEPGRKHADVVAAQIKSIAKSVKIVESAVGKDVSDHIAAGKALEELVTVSLLDKLGVTSDWLNEQQFPELEFAVPGLISEGLGMLVAPPKKGKSFLVGNLAIAVAAGGKALGHIDVKQRPVLVLALEDGHRRLQDRYTKINGDEPIPSGITFITKATPQECLAVIAEYQHRYCDQKPLIIIDTLGKVKPPKRSGEEQYGADYNIGSKFKELADSVPGSTILIIHHTRKADAVDFVDQVSGTQGLAGSVDFVLALDRKRHENDAILSVTGRDVTEAEFALVAESGMIWRLDGMSLAAAAARAEQRRDETAEAARLRRLGTRAQDIVKLIDERGQATPPEVAFKFGMTSKIASNLLGRLVEADFIVHAGRGEYRSKRHPFPRESGESGELEDIGEHYDDDDSPLSPHSSDSLHSLLSSDVVVDLGNRKLCNTCPCGGKLTSERSRERGICTQCWAKGIRETDCPTT